MNPIKIICTAIRNRIKGTDIYKFLLSFEINEANGLPNKYILEVSNKDNKVVNYDISEDEITLIKTHFINRLVTDYKTKSGNELIKIDITIEPYENKVNVYGTLHNNSFIQLL
jgi:hypothetical protein